MYSLKDFENLNIELFLSPRFDGRRLLDQVNSIQKNIDDYYREHPEEADRDDCFDPESGQRICSPIEDLERQLFYSEEALYEAVFSCTN